MYDTYGEDDGDSAAGGGGGGHGGHHHGFYREQDLNPEDIFNMFFGVPPGHMRRGGGHHRVYRYGRGVGGHHADDENRGGQQTARGGLLQQLMQLLPLIFLFLVSFGSSSSYNTHSQHFSLYQTSVYPIKRHTQTPHIVANIPYYVDETFQRTYARDSNTLQQMEMRVESQFESTLRQQCANQKEQQRRMVYRARNQRNKKTRESELAKAQQYEMNYCTQLRELFGG